MVAWHQRYTRLLHQLLGLRFQAHRQNGRRRRTNEDQPGSGAGLRKLFVFAQETIARVNCLRAGALGRLDDALPAQVAVLGSAAADVNRFIARRHMFGVGIRIGIDRYRFDSQPRSRGGHPAGNLPTVCNENFLEHACFSPVIESGDALLAHPDHVIVYCVQLAGLTAALAISQGTACDVVARGITPATLVAHGERPG